MSEPKSLPLARIFWLLDYDGSLCPHREAWEVGHYEPKVLRQILDALSSRSRGLMWNTGRSVESLATQAEDFLKHPGFFEHGTCFWDGQKKMDLVKTVLNPAIVEGVKAWADERREWIRLEFKTHSLRVIPMQEQDRSRLRAEFTSSKIFRAIAADPSIYASEGWRAFEILLTGANKAAAVDYLVSNVGAFKGALPVAVGDDMADSGVVRAVLSLGGHAFLVGNHCGWVADIPHKASQVSFFTSPQELLAHLSHVADKGEI
ncbi:MAG TPA: hypothetical protein VM901_13195 [Bdellovibrionota bacterium]|jgi:trehalose-6-phosphatase|nr:hypothetical protein [Bdellovibrionota bacterium]